MNAITMTWPQYQRGECTVDGVRIYMAPLRAEILAVLMMRRGCVVSTSELADVCWPDPDEMPDAPEENVKIHVCKLRRQIQGVIETCWGRGYLIPLPEQQQRLAA